MSTMPAESHPDDRFIVELYQLTPEQCRVYRWLESLVDEALDQFEKGYAVDVELEMAHISKAMRP